MKALTTGKWWYLIIVILIAVTTYFSMAKMSTAPTMPDQEKQTKMMTIFMVGFITIMSMQLNVGIGLYWIATSAFAVLQNLILKTKKN